MYLETYRESGSFKHFAYEPERDRDFGMLYCGKSDSGDEETVKPTGGPPYVTDPPTGRL